MDWLAVVGLTVDGIRGGRRTSSWTVVGVAGLAVGLANSRVGCRTGRRAGSWSSCRYDRQSGLLY